MKEALKKTLYAGLQYGLKVIIEGDDNVHELVGMDRTSMPIKLISPYGDCGYSKINDHVKPILYSLPMLTKPITIGGETFVPLLELFRLYETNQFYPEDNMLRKLKSNLDLSACKLHHFKSDYDNGQDIYLTYPVETSNYGILEYSFGYDPDLRRFHARDCTRKEPKGVAFQIDLIEKLHEWHFNCFGLDNQSYIKAEEGNYY